MQRRQIAPLNKKEEEEDFYFYIRLFCSHHFLSPQSNYDGNFLLYAFGPIRKEFCISSTAAGPKVFREIANSQREVKEEEKLQSNKKGRKFFSSGRLLLVFFLGRSFVRSFVHPRFEKVFTAICRLSTDFGQNAFCCAAINSLLNKCNIVVVFAFCQFIKKLFLHPTLLKISMALAWKALRARLTSTGCFFANALLLLLSSSVSESRCSSWLVPPESRFVAIDKALIQSTAEFDLQVGDVGDSGSRNNARGGGGGGGRNWCVDTNVNILAGFNGGGDGNSLSSTSLSFSSILIGVNWANRSSVYLAKEATLGSTTRNMPRRSRSGEWDLFRKPSFFFVGPSARSNSRRCNCFAFTTCSLGSFLRQLLVLFFWRRVCSRHSQRVERGRRFLQSDYSMTSSSSAWQQQTCIVLIILIFPRGNHAERFGLNRVTSTRVQKKVSPVWFLHPREKKSPNFLRFFLFRRLLNAKWSEPCKKPFLR